LADVRSCVGARNAAVNINPRRDEHGTVVVSILWVPADPLIVRGYGVVTKCPRSSLADVVEVHPVPVGPLRVNIVGDEGLFFISSRPGQGPPRSYLGTEVGGRLPADVGAFVAYGRRQVAYVAVSPPGRGGARCVR